MIVLWAACLIGVIVSAVGFWSSLDTAYADIEDGESEVQGWCITGPDPRAATDPHFQYAVTGQVNEEANKNDPIHVHLDDLVKDGWLVSIADSYGHNYILSVYWVHDEAGNHARAYVPKTDRGLDEVTCAEALQATGDIADQYLPRGADVEMLRQKGLGSSGQTNTEQGRKRGEE